MANLRKIVYLTEAQKAELFAQGSITSNGTTITYNQNDLYITPDKSIDTITLNGTNYSAVNGVANLGHVLTSTDNSIIAPVETSSTASQLYNVGDLFIYNDQLYVATASIPTDTNITPNTNCSLTSVAEKLDDLKLDVQVNGTSVVNNGVATIPISTGSADGAPGLISIINYEAGLYINSNNHLSVVTADSSYIKAGTNSMRSLVPLRQHEAVFYGLTKAAGVDMASSSNAVGTYTDEAKAAIHTMLGIDPASIAAQVDIPLVETVSGTTPTITGQPNVRYVCGEVSTISITPPASGSVDVIFESGSTATTMTVPSTVKWPAWFDAEALEANTTYEILITDGVYGSVMTWAT